MSDHTLTALFHGPSGVGKSWLGGTCPKPLLVLDAEGRARYVKTSGIKIYWDVEAGTVKYGDGRPVAQVTAGGPPAADGTWHTCIVAVSSFKTVDLVYQWLRSGQHHFISVVMDSLMEVQRRCIDAMVPGTKALERDDYSVLLREVEKKVREYRDLRLIEQTGVRCVVFITGSNKENGPMLTGAMRDMMAYYIDVVGFMFKQANAEGQFVRQVLVDEQPGFVAKDGTDRLKSHYGPVIPLPEENPPTQYIEQWFNTLLANGDGGHVVATTEEVA